VRPRSPHGAATERPVTKKDHAAILTASQPHGQPTRQTKEIDVTPDATALADFARSFTGSALCPSDPGFAEARAAAVWNGAITRQPGLIVQPTTNEQVAKAVLFAGDEGAELTVRGGGHGFAGNTVADGAVMIDLSQLCAVRVDPAARRAYVGGGASLAMLDAATAAHGLAVVGGTVSHTGIAGLTLSGGMGWLTRSQGLSCDNLVEATLVTAEGRVVTASAEEEPELFWGLRGAGANFGVVTELVFGLREVNPMANLGLLFWRADEAETLLRLAGEYLPALPPGSSSMIAGLSAPPAPFVPEDCRGAAGFATLVVNWGSAEEHAALLAPLRDLKPLFELVTPIPYVGLQQMLDEGSPWGCLAYDKGLYLDDLSGAVAKTLAEQVTRKSSPMSVMPMFHLDSAYCEMPVDATAFGGTRRPTWAVSATGIALDQQTYELERAWSRSAFDALRAHARDDSTYLNFSSEVEDAQARARVSYGEAKYHRLAALKARWDPENLFRYNANVPPKAAPAGASV
jgi:FAD/FMN-containing dehydrogenase